MINATQKEGIRYLEHCKLLVNDERLSIVKKESSIEKFYSIPYFNLCVILLGEGTSITQKAAKFLASQGIMLGFVGTGGTPLFLAAQNEYRPTHYFNEFIKIWIDPIKKLDFAKSLQKERIAYLTKNWSIIFDKKFDDSLGILNSRYLSEVDRARDEQSILIAEAKYTKNIFKIMKTHYSVDFTREHKKREDQYNKNLDDGNYLAYGLASAVLWTLGIPASMSVLHGRTRNGGLVFDIADVIKDGLILPHAFVGVSYFLKGAEQRKLFIDKIDEYKALEFMFSVLNKYIIRKNHEDSSNS